MDPEALQEHADAAEAYRIVRLRWVLGAAGGGPMPRWRRAQLLREQAHEAPLTVAEAEALGRGA